MKFDMAVNNLVLDNEFGLGLTIHGVVWSDADVVGINSNTRRSRNAKIG